MTISRPNKPNQGGGMWTDHPAPGPIEETPIYFFEHLGPDIEWAQCEAAGFSFRVGNHAWVFGRLDYREKTCPRWWPRFAITLGHRPYPHRSRRWKLHAFGRTLFDIGGHPR